MGIVSVTTSVPGQVGSIIGGVCPRRVKLVVTDTYAILTAAGYITPELLGGFPVFPTDIFDVLYSYVAATNTGTYTELYPAFNNGVITLSPLPVSVGLPVVSGNLVSFNGTTGILADSGVSAASLSSAVTQLGSLSQATVTLTPAQIIAAFATPQVLIAAAAGKVAIVHSANIYTASTGNTPFATGTAPIIQYGTTVHGAGTSAVGAGLVTGDIEAAASQVRTVGPTASTAWTGITNTPVTFSAATAYTAGTGTNITFTLVYELITASV
jgi:hypothetical protein